MIDTGAVYSVVCAVVDVVIGIQQPNPRRPVVRFLRPVAVGAISRVSCETGSELEEAAVCNRGFIVKASVVGVELPL